LWIRDLADKDPTYITPLLMGATMYFQQKMSTVSADPTQMKMMSLMPIFFTFIFLSFPSGLVLYWLVTNVLAIGHQLYINRKQ
jgi:YidC/Oxa1 family membrane protein insertase